MENDVYPKVWGQPEQCSDTSSFKTTGIKLEGHKYNIESHSVVIIKVIIDHYGRL